MWGKEGEKGMGVILTSYSSTARLLSALRGGPRPSLGPEPHMCKIGIMFSKLAWH